MRTVLFRKYHLSVGYELLRKTMAAANLQSVIRRKKRLSKGQQRIDNYRCKNILNRDFKAHTPGQKYATDITYIPIRNSMVYLSVVLDLLNNEIVSYTISTIPDKKLSLDTIRDLSSRRSLNGAIIHSDQGIHYTNNSYHQLLKEQGAIISMSRKGNCWDNAVAENFFSHYKTECISIFKKRLRTFEDVFEVTENYIYYYNYERYQKGLHEMSPVEYRLNNFKN